jgi:hypothetical protein
MVLDKHIKELLKKEMSRKDFLSLTALAFISLFGVAGVISKLLSHAATPYASEESESGTLNGAVTKTTDSTASGGNAVTFGMKRIPPPSLVSYDAPNGLVGQRYSFQFEATNAVSYSMEIFGNPTPPDVGSLPDGLTLSSSGLLSGIPTKADTYYFNVVSSNSGGSAISLPIIIVINYPAPVFTDSTPTAAVVGKAYSYTFKASNTTSYSVSAGNIPPELNFSGDGVLAGKPSTAGVFSFTVTAVGQGGVTSKAVKVTVTATYPTGPASPYSDWYFPGDKYTSLQWTLTPLAIASGANKWTHYYAFNFYLNGFDQSISGTGGGYAGIQNLAPSSQSFAGKHCINYAIWGATNGNSTTKSTVINPNNLESGGYSMIMPYDYVVQHAYRFDIKQGPGGVGWWGLYVTDNTAKTATVYVGQLKLPTTLNGISSTTWGPHVSFFGEDITAEATSDGSQTYTCTELEKSSTMITRVSANSSTVNPASMTSQTSCGVVRNNNGFISIACTDGASVYENTAFQAQHNLGTWSPIPPSSLSPEGILVTGVFPVSPS